MCLVMSHGPIVVRYIMYTQSLCCIYASLIHHAYGNSYILVLPHRQRLDKGTETGLMATIHCYLRDKVGDVDDATDTVLYGPSTQNKIERWWRELLERMERYFKEQLNGLLEDGDYDPTNENDRYTPYVALFLPDN